MTKIPNKKIKKISKASIAICDFGFGICLGFGICNLEFNTKASLSTG
jgi:hypothetical protein